LVGRPLGKRLLGRRRRWEHKTEMKLKKMGYDEGRRTELAQNRV
jgi:hypothetical protein